MSPLPWRVEYEADCRILDRDGGVVAEGVSKEDADFIVESIDTSWNSSWQTWPSSPANLSPLIDLYNRIIGQASTPTDRVPVPTLGTDLLDAPTT